MRNWNDVLPESVALRQAQWERRRLIARMRDSGMKLNKIAEKMGVSNAAISQSIKVMKLERNKISPVERYFNRSLREDLIEFREYLGKHWARHVERTYGISLP